MTTVNTIKEILPDSDIFEFQPDRKYLIVIADFLKPEQAKLLADACGPNVMVLTIPDPKEAVRVLAGEGLHDIDFKYPWEAQ